MLWRLNKYATYSPYRMFIYETITLYWLKDFKLKSVTVYIICFLSILSDSFVRKKYIGLYMHYTAFVTQLVSAFGC